jgi:aminobenzoyl-glutamate transport protein
VKAVSLLSPDGIRFMFTEAVANYTGFAPLGTVLVVALGSSIAEHSGLIIAFLRKIVYGANKNLVSLLVVFVGVMGNIASDAAYVIIVPLGAVVFLGVGRHPLAGLFAALAGVSGGFSANLLLTSLDPLLGGISTEAAKLLNPDYIVQPTANWYFMIMYTIVLSFVGAYTTDKIVEPRLGTYEGPGNVSMDPLTSEEQKGLRYAKYTILVYLAIMALLLVPANGILRNPHTGSIMENSPFMKGLVPILMLFFGLPGAAYGIGAGTVKSHRDVVRFMTDGMAAMSSYVVLVFASAQFVAYFSYSKLGTILAVKGAEFLEESGMIGLPMIIAFVLVCAIINLFMSSASAKWVILAPIFVPMLMRVGYSPEFVQLAYRIGDSCTNIITPLMFYYAMMLVFAQKYDKNAGMGTMVSAMLPYSITFLLSGILLLSFFYATELPIGVGVNLFLK